MCRSRCRESGQSEMPIVQVSQGRYEARRSAHNLFLYNCVSRLHITSLSDVSQSRKFWFISPGSVPILAGDSRFLIFNSQAFYFSKCEKMRTSQFSVFALRLVWLTERVALLVRLTRLLGDREERQNLQGSGEPYTSSFGRGLP
jgi:hypothetical protein